MLLTGTYAVQREPPRHRTRTGKPGRHPQQIVKLLRSFVGPAERPLLVIWPDAILDGLKTLLNLRSTLMTERSVAVDRQHIPARFVQHPQFSVGIPIEPPAVQDTSEIEGEACGPRFRLDRYRHELLSLKLCGCLFNSPE